MIVVIIAGGSGTRLWPLSTPEYPKHLLALTGQRTLLQMTFDRVGRLTKADHVFVVSEKSHANHVAEQLAEMPADNILVEPARRGTGNCLLFALHAIKARGLPADEPIAIFWADHVINDHAGFAKTILTAAAASSREQKIVDIGIHPTYASTGFGYIQRGAAVQDASEVYEIKSFAEKPNHATAERYIAEGGYYWNTGYLVAPLQVFERDLERYAPLLWKNYQNLLNSEVYLQAYEALESANLERNLNEQDPEMLVVPSNFDWIDVGSHGDLHGISVQDKHGNVVVGDKIAVEDVTHSLIRNQTDLPVAVIGVKDIVVVVTDNGVLVSSKSDAQKVGDVAKRLQA